MNITEQVEIYAPKGSLYANEVAAYHKSGLLDKSGIANILHKQNISIDCIVFAKKEKKKSKSLLDREVIGVVFIQNDMFNDYVSQFVSLALLKKLKNKILILNESEDSRLILRRIIHAHKIGAPADIICKLAVHKECDGTISLQVTAADFTEITIDSKKINSIAKMSYNELQNFEIEEYGFYITWPKQDIHLNLDSFKMISDPKIMKKRIKEIEKEKSNFGELMKNFREANGKLTQKDFGNLSERQIRKYENGENFPSYESLQVISHSYNMSVNDYLNALSEFKKDTQSEQK
jgi:hypothetical protein